MFSALLTSRYQVSVYRTNGPLVSSAVHLYSLICNTLLASLIVQYLYLS